MARVDGGCSGSKHLNNIHKIFGYLAIQPVLRSQHLDPVRAVVAWLARPLFKFVGKTNLPLPPAAPTEGYRRKDLRQGYVHDTGAVTSRDVSWQTLPGKPFDGGPRKIQNKGPQKSGV